MEPLNNLCVGRWYYVDRLDGVRQEEVLAVSAQQIVVRDEAGNLSTIAPGKIIAQSPKPSNWTDYATSEYSSLMLAALLITMSFRRR